MNTKNILFIIFLAVFFSCGDEDKNTEELENSVEIKVLYSTNDNPNDEKSDVDAGIFIYYDIYTGDLADYSYEGNGRFVYGELIIMPDKVAKAESNGNIILLPKEVDKVTIVTESKYYDGRWNWSSIYPLLNKTPFKSIFKP